MIFATRSLWRIVWIRLNFNDIVDQIILLALACFTLRKEPKSVFLRILNRLQLLPFSHMFMAVKNYFHPQENQKSPLFSIENSTFSILYSLLILSCWHLAPKNYLNNAHCDNICVGSFRDKFVILTWQIISLFSPTRKNSLKRLGFAQFSWSIIQFDDFFKWNYNLKITRQLTWFCAI